MQSDVERLNTELVAVMGRLQVAREMGDLSENGAYHYAKFELGSIRRQLAQLKHLLETGEIVEKKIVDGKVSFGATVTLALGKKQIVYTLVSAHESNPSEKKLSIESPIGQALMNRRAGDNVEVVTPAGKVAYSIMSVE